MNEWDSLEGSTLALIGVGLILGWCVLRLRRVDGSVLKVSLVLSAVALILHLASRASEWLEFTSAATVLAEVTVVVLGIIALRISLITLSRVTLPAFGLTPPRIVEDLLVLFAYATWIMVRMHAAGVELSGIVTTSAVITGIVAFSAQETLGNIFGGLALQIDNSIHIGDWLEVDTVSGKVVEVHWRHTAVQTRDGEIIVIPNALLMKSTVKIVASDRVVQWRQTVHFTVDQNVPPQEVIESIDQLLLDATIPNLSKEPAPNCVLKRFEGGLAHYSVRYWLLDPQSDDPVNSNVLVHVYAALQRKGFRLGRPGFDALITSDSGEREARLRDQDIDRRLKALEKIELFSVLSDAERAQLAENLTEAMFVEGDLITRQGAEAHSLYILVRGEVDVWFEPDVPGQPRIHVTHLRPGQIFGEMGLMTGEQRSATVTARTHVGCFRLDKSSFEQILHARPALAQSLAGILSERSLRKSGSGQGAAHGAPAPHHDSLVSAIRRFFGLQV